MTYASYPSLSGRHVFVTGGATGIGSAIVREFAAQAAQVTFIDIAVAEGEALARDIGECVSFLRCDVTSEGALVAAISASRERFGEIGVLVNNVANDQRSPADAVDLAAWRSSMAINLEPAYLAARAVAPQMRRRGTGSIVNISSINALLGPADLSAYTAAKAAILGLTKSLAREWGAEGVRVNALSPGWVVTERQLALWLTPEAEADWMKQVALRKRILPEDVARAVLFLAADDSAMITGQNLIVDGGRT